jgi:excisionase family DNA binding protein
MTNDTDSSTQPTLWGEVPGARRASTRSRGPANQRRSVAEAGELWTIEQVADYLGVPKQTVYSRRTSGYGPSGFRVGKHLRWRVSTVMAWTVELEHRK